MIKSDARFIYDSTFQCDALRSTRWQTSAQGQRGACQLSRWHASSRDYGVSCAVFRIFAENHTFLSETEELMLLCTFLANRLSI